MLGFRACGRTLITPSTSGFEAFVHFFMHCPCEISSALGLGHVQVGSYCYRSLIEGLYTL